MYTQAQLADIYTPLLGKDITLDKVYEMAEKLTERYRSAGYFLSVAYVPNQHLKDGSVKLQVVEGYVGEIDFPATMDAHGVVQTYVDRLKAQRPITIDQLESFLLRLGNLPGYAVNGVLSPLTEGAPGAVKLTLNAATTSGKGQIGFDNYSSRFLGPNELSASYSVSILPLQQTTLSGLTSIPTDKLN